MDIQTLLKNLKNEKLPFGEYAVFVSAILTVKRLKEVPNIDVIVTDKLWEQLKDS